MAIVEKELLIISSYYSRWQHLTYVACLLFQVTLYRFYLLKTLSKHHYIRLTEAGKLLLKTCWNTSLAWCQKCVCLSNLQVGGHGCGIPFIKESLEVENPGETYPVLLFFPHVMGVGDLVEKMSRTSLHHKDMKQPDFATFSNFRNLTLGKSYCFSNLNLPCLGFQQRIFCV